MRNEEKDDKEKVLTLPFQKPCCLNSKAALLQQQLKRRPEVISYIYTRSIFLSYISSCPVLFPAPDHALCHPLIRRPDFIQYHFPEYRCQQGIYHLFCTKHQLLHRNSSPPSSRRMIIKIGEFKTQKPGSGISSDFSPRRPRRCEPPEK